MKRSILVCFLLVCLVILPLSGCGGQEILPESLSNPESEVISDIGSEISSTVDDTTSAVKHDVEEIGSQMEDASEVSSETNSKSDKKEPSQATLRQQYYLRINRAMNTCTVYTKDDKGKFTVPVKAIVVSCGGSNTPLGTFSIGTQYRWLLMVGDVYSQYASRVTGPILIHSIPYYQQDNSTLCYREYNKLGQTASHGCIRMTYTDAKWVMDNCSRGTGVEIYDDYSSTGPLGKPTVAKIPIEGKLRNWDPGDTDPNNPWHDLKEPTLVGVKDSTVELGTNFKPLKGVTAKDTFGESLTDAITVKGKVNSKKVGKYDLKYTVTDAYGKTSDASAVITIVDTTAPTISFDLADHFFAESEAKGCAMIKAGVTASDLSKIVSLNVKLKLQKTRQYTETSNHSRTVLRTSQLDTSAPEILQPDESELESSTESSDTTSSEESSSDSESFSSSESSSSSEESSSSQPDEIVHTYTRYTYLVKAVAVDAYDNKATKDMTISFTVKNK